MKKLNTGKASVHDLGHKDLEAKNRLLLTFKSNTSEIRGNKKIAPRNYIIYA